MNTSLNVPPLPMLVTKAPGFDREVPGETVLKRTVDTALEMENGQLAALEGAGIVGWEDDAIEYPGSATQHAALDVPAMVSKSRSFSPSTAILRRYRQRKSSLEEAMLELYHGNISVAKAEELAGQLWGAGADLALVSETNRSITGRIQAWLQREITEPQVYVFCQAIEVKQKINGESKIIRLVAAIGLGRKGTRQTLAVLGAPEPAGGLWDRLFSDLKRRGLHGTELFLGENVPAVARAAAVCFPEARYQGCLLQLEREVLARVPAAQIIALTMAFRELRASATEEQALRAAEAMVAGLRANGSHDAAALLERSAPFQFSYFHFPKSHRARLHDNEPLRRVMHEFRETIRTIGPVPDSTALTLILAARLRCASRLAWARRRYIAFK